MVPAMARAPYKATALSERISIRSTADTGSESRSKVESEIERPLTRIAARNPPRSEGAVETVAVVVRGATR